MRRDSNLSAGGAVIKVGFTKSAEASDAAQELMRLNPNLSAGGAVTMVGKANAFKHCTSSGKQTRYRCKWCNSPYSSRDVLRQHAVKQHAEHFLPKQRYSLSHYGVEEVY